MSADLHGSGSFAALGAVPCFADISFNFNFPSRRSVFVFKRTASLSAPHVHEFVSQASSQTKHGIAITVHIFWPCNHIYIGVLTYFAVFMAADHHKPKISTVWRLATPLSYDRTQNHSDKTADEFAINQSFIAGG